MKLSSIALVSLVLGIVCSFSVYTPALAVRMAMEMDHGDGDAASDDEKLKPAPSLSITQEASTTPSATLVAVPHVEKHHHGLPILETHLKPEERLFWENYNPTTFLSAATPENKFGLHLHIITILITLIFVYPLSMVAKNVNSMRFYIPLFSLHTIIMLLSLLSLSIYGAHAPNLYPGNAYGIMSWILVFTTLIHAISALLYVGTTQTSLYSRIDEESASLTASTASNSSSNDWEHSDRVELHRLINEKIPIKFNFPSDSIFHKLFNNVKSFAKLIGISNVVLFNTLHWGHFFFYLIYIPTGITVLFVLGTGNKVFNLLAHFIKGGVFFALGLLSLARYCGAFENLGWSWNYKISKSIKDRVISMEMVESSLILFYGCTNIFLEHLANAGGEWSAKDLQHASIAFIYIGAGVCGVVTELKLKSWRTEKVISKLKEHEIDGFEEVVSGSPGFSPNPFPIFTIYWTGILMSQHAQASETSTAIHIQWGQLLVGATAFRFMTYLLMMLLPTSKHLTKPSKPITELMTSFSLICGGFVFMTSCDPVILAIEYRGFTPMFTLNLSLGFVALLMAWEMLIFAFKDWLVFRSNTLHN